MHAPCWRCNVVYTSLQSYQKLVAIQLVRFTLLERVGKDRHYVPREVSAGLASHCMRCIPRGVLPLSSRKGEDVIRHQSLSSQQDDASLHLSSYATTCSVYELDGVSGFNNDNNTYESIKSIDANLHVMETLQDALGNKLYERYDSGANNTSLSSSELVAYQYNAQLATLSFQTSTNTSLASEQFTYDGDLRPATLNATWGGGSGNSGTIFTQSRSYDLVGNVTSLSTTFASVPGQSGSGGSETQDFCYDEQSRLVFASNTQAPSPTGSQTCGSTTPSSGLLTGSYSDSFVYTHLGQLWQGPLNDGPTQYQYLYCNTSAHQLSGLYLVGNTCSSKSGAVYKNSSYDAWGNVTGITSGGTSYALASYALDRLVKDTIDSNDNEHYAYDASGTRTLRRTISGGIPTLTVYAFGLEEHSYSSNGTLQNNTYYYSLNGRLIGELTGLTTQTTNIFLTDPLGSVVATFSNTAGSAALSGNQAYGPYGHLRYNAGGLSGMGTSKGFTGQDADAFSGLDYYQSRYYEPAVGVFLSADSKEGNQQGMDPYMYVGGNPQTYNDPTGEFYAPPPQGNGNPPPNCEQGNVLV